MIILVHFKPMTNSSRGEDFKWHVVYDNKSWYKLPKLREVSDSLSGEQFGSVVTLVQTPPWSIDVILFVLCP